LPSTRYSAAVGPLVRIRRQWNSSQIGSVPLAKIGGFHWSDFSGGTKAIGIQPFIYGYCDCTDVQGEIGHSCIHGPPPHHIKVCVIKKDNEGDLFAAIKAVADKAQFDPAADQADRRASHHDDGERLLASARAGATLRAVEEERAAAGITSNQVRIGRGLLGWTELQLAEAAGSTKKTVQMFEAGLHVPRPERLRLGRALMGAGVELVPEQGSGPTVRLLPLAKRR